MKNKIAMPKLSHVLVLVAGLGAASAQANLLVNGSFENTDNTFVANFQDYETVTAPSTAIPGWSVFVNNVAWDHDGNPYGNTASEGAYSLDLTGVSDNSDFGGVSQTFATVAGATYHLDFDLGVNNGFCGGLDCSGPAGVHVNFVGVVQQDFKDYDPVGGAQIWKTFGMDFTATGASTTLQIQGIQAGHFYTGLDNVVVTALAAPVPEPETYAMLLAGMALIAAVARRKTQRRS